MRNTLAGMSVAGLSIAGLSIAVIAVSALTIGPAAAQKQGGTLRIYHRDNPPSASIHEEATISTVMPFMAVFNNLVHVRPAPAHQQHGDDRSRPRRKLGLGRDARPS